MNLIPKNLSQLRRIALSVLLASFAILETTSISAQELGRTITSPFGVANPYMNASDASESGSNGDTFVDPETGEVGHIIRNPFGVANPNDVDTGIDIPDDAGEEVGGIITSPFGVPASDDIDTGVDVFDEDEEYLISLPDDEESDAEDAEDVDEVDDETSDDAKDIEEESYENPTEKALPVIDNPTRGVEYTIELSLTGSTGPAAEQYSVESTAGNIYAAPTLYVAPGGKLTLTVASTDNQTLVKENISFYFDGTHLDALSGVFENKQYLSGSSSSSSHVFRYNVSDNVSPNVVCNPHNVAVLYRYNNNVTIARYLRIEIKVFSILIDSNNDGAINSKDEATKKSGKLIHINNLDIDNDGIPDFADGYYSNGTQLPDLNNYNSESLPFTPLVIRISPYLDVSKLRISFFFDDADIITEYNWSNPPSFIGALRLWHKDGNTIRLVEDNIEPYNIFPLNDLNGLQVGEYIEYTLYLEAIRPCNSKDGTPVIAWIGTHNNLSIEDSDYVDMVMVTPYQVVFEGITNDETENSHVVYNPCGIIKKTEESGEIGESGESGETGETAMFHFDTIPSGIPCTTVNWSASDNLTFVGGNTGKSVTVCATGEGDSDDFSLIIDIGRGDKFNPSIKGKILEETTVKLFVWVVADNTNGVNPVISSGAIDSLIDDVNQIYKQVGIKFEKTPIKYIQAVQSVQYNNETVERDYRSISEVFEESGDIIARELISYPQNPQNPGCPREEDGLEIFFVDSLNDGGTILGLSYPGDGIIVASNTDFRTLGHEIGHACGLEDIYPWKGSGNDYVELNEKVNVNSLWIKKDCTYAGIPNNNTMSAAGYYRYDLKQKNLLEKLLMYGYNSYEERDLSLGKVYGIDVCRNFDNVKTGLEDMNRNPIHNR